MKGLTGRILFAAFLACGVVGTGVALPPMRSAVHLHPHLADDRIVFRLYNSGISFRDIKIDGQVYTVEPHQTLWVKAPVGTVIYAEGNVPAKHKGDVMLVVTAELEQQWKQLF